MASAIEEWSHNGALVIVMVAALCDNGQGWVS